MRVTLAAMVGGHEGEVALRSCPVLNLGQGFGPTRIVGP
jgi:hypothetical protein